MSAWINGFITARVMKFFGASEWCFAAFASAIIFPFYLFAILLSVDFIEYLKKSSDASPPVTVIVSGIIWITIAIPLTFQGAYTGFKKDKFKTGI